MTAGEIKELLIVCVSLGLAMVWGVFIGIRVGTPKSAVSLTSPNGKHVIELEATDEGGIIRFGIAAEPPAVGPSLLINTNGVLIVNDKGMASLSAEGVQTQAPEQGP